MRFLFLIGCILLTTILSAEQRALPTTSEALDIYIQNAHQTIQKTLLQITSIPDEQKTVENTFHPWNRLSNEILADLSMLTFLSHTPFPCQDDAETALENYLVYLYQNITLNENVHYSLIAFLNHTLNASTTHSPYEHYSLQRLLDSFESIRSALSEDAQANLDHLQVINSQYEQTPYLYLESQAIDKTQPSSPTELTVFCLNTCFFPGDFPYLFGGVYQPWQERVVRLSQKILSVDADIVCLQEVQPEDASIALYQNLKESYPYFYASIAPRILGLTLDTLGLPSGLFVASKYPIEQPAFSLFSQSGFPMNYGFFDFIVKNGQTPIAHLYTTHLQSLKYDSFDQIRALQLNEILVKMHADLDSIPFFLCGDLNIPYGSQEPGLALISTYFYDDYNKNQTAITASNRTCTDYFTNYIFSPIKDPEQIDPYFQIIDYALLLRPTEAEIETVLVPMNDLSQPYTAVTDHHGLLTTIKLRK